MSFRYNMWNPDSRAKQWSYYIYDEINYGLNILSSPKTWPIWVRRAYLLTLPVSFPLLCITTVIGAISFGVIFVILSGIVGISDLWSK